MSLTDLFRDAVAFDKGPAEFVLYREFADRLARLSRFDDARDFCLMRSCRESRNYPIRPATLRELSMIAYNQTIDCGGAQNTRALKTNVLEP